MSLDYEDIVAVGCVAAVALVSLLVASRLGFNLSYTVRAALLVLLFVGLLTVKTANRTVTLISVLVAGAAIFAGIYVPAVFEFPRPVWFLSAWFTALLSVGIVYRVHQGTIALRNRPVHLAVAVLVVASVLLIGVDLAIGGVEYSAAIQDEVRPTEDRLQVTVGTATARATSFLREPVDFPGVRACLYDGDGRTDVGWKYDYPWVNFETGVPGSGTLTIDLDLLFTQTQIEGLSTPVPVERAQSCPGERSEPGVVVVVDRR